MAESAVAQGAARCRHRSSRSSLRSRIRYSQSRGPWGIPGSTLGLGAMGVEGLSRLEVEPEATPAVVSACNQGGTVGPPAY